MTERQAIDAILRLLERLDARIDEMEKNARESRGRLHQRMDEQGESIGELRKDIEIAAMVTAQQRDTIVALGGQIAKIEPDVDQWRQMRKLGYGFSGLLVALGVTGSGAIIYLGETARAAIRKWLGV